MTRNLAMGIFVFLFGAVPLRADEEVQFLDADKLPLSAKLVAAGPGQRHRLQVAGPTDDKGATILVIENPRVAAPEYLLRGRIKYSDVRKTTAKVMLDGVERSVDRCGYVEMWSHFPGNEAYFSRTLADMGPMAKLEGTSDWREINLPFTSAPGKLPVKLVVNVVLPGTGVVEFEPFVLSPSGWWSEQESGLVGGIGGGAIGLCGAVIGVLAGIGAARRVVIGMCIAVIAIGAACLTAGIVGLLLGQPWYVYYPFLLGGSISVAVCGFNLPAIRKRYDALELRRMTAMDA